MSERRKKRAARLQAWQTTLSSFNDPFSARAHKYIRGEWAVPLTCITLDDNSVVTELTQMDLAVTEACQEVAKPKGVTLEASRSRLDELAEAVPECPTEELRPIDHSQRPHASSS
eukprot:757937-Amphidinium_carterae.1